MRIKLKNISKTNLFYLPFKLVEGIVGIVALTLYTKLFGKAAFGSYSIVNANASLIAILSIGWLRFVTARYIKEYSIKGEREKFFSSVVFSYLLSIGVGMMLMLLSIVFLVEKFSLLSLLLYGLFYISYTFSQLFVDLLLYDDKRMLNIVIIMLSAVLKPLIAYILHLIHFDPYLAIITAFLIVDLSFGTYAIFKMGLLKNINRERLDLGLLKNFATYGFPLIGLSLTIYVLNASNKYIIRFFFSDAEVGIYSANYAIATSAFTLLTLGLSKGFYPNLLSKWAEGRVKESSALLSRALKIYLFLGLPSAIGLAFISYDLSFMLFGETYLEAYMVIGLTSIGMFFFGLSEYFNKGYELKKDTFQITKNSITVAVINIVLNFIFTPIYGYIAAALVTVFSFAVYAFICYLRREKSISFRVELSFLAKLLLSNGIMIISLSLVYANVSQGAFRLVALMLSGALIYAVCTLAFLRKDIFIMK